MDHSIILVTWTIKDHQLDISRQITISPDVDPLDLNEAEIRDLAMAQGFNIHGDTSWEILIDNSRYSHMSEDRRRAVKLSEKIDRLISELQDAANVLAEIASN